jgi:hypothetical protein
VKGSTRKPCRRTAVTELGHGLLEETILRFCRGIVFCAFEQQTRPSLSGRADTPCPGVCASGAWRGTSGGGGEGLCGVGTVTSLTAFVSGWGGVGTVMSLTVLVFVPKGSSFFISFLLCAGHGAPGCAMPCVTCVEVRASDCSNPLAGTVAGPA